MIVFPPYANILLPAPNTRFFEDKSDSEREDDMSYLEERDSMTEEHTETFREAQMRWIQEGMERERQPEDARPATHADILRVRYELQRIMDMLEKPHCRCQSPARRAEMV